MKKIWLLIFVCTPIISAAQKQVILTQSVHLRDGVKREWSNFPLQAKDSQLVIHFDIKNIAYSKTLAVTQTDVNHIWNVVVNDQTLGALVLDEQKLVATFSIPASILKKHRNTLIIRSSSSNAAQADDIRIENVVMYNSPIENVMTESSLNIHSGIPSRLTILNEEGALQPVKATVGDTLAIRCGVIYSGTGNFSFQLPAGIYRVYASRGFEYGVDSAVIAIRTGQTISKHFTLRHEIDLKNWASMDTHVHTLEFSGHGDASMKERILTIAGEGLDYAVITEHNRVANIGDSVKTMKLDKWFTPISGDELTTSVGHFNVFPVSEPPSHEVHTWQQVKESIALNREAKIVILNHARDDHNGVRPIDTITRLSAAQMPINAMEVMNSGSQQTDPRQLYLDWLGLISRGIVLTPVGSSDSHDVSRFIVGQSRTYVHKGDLVANFLSGNVGVSFGLFTELLVDTVSKNEVTVNVYAPSWVRPARLRLFANGKEIYVTAINDRDKSDKNIFSRKIDIPKFSNEIILVAVAEGNDPHSPWWPIAKPYQHASTEVNPIVLGLTGPVKVSP